MILAIDIGNSRITVGCVDKDQIWFQEQISTDLHRTSLEYAFLLKSAMEFHQIRPETLEGGMIASVVPPLSETLREAASLLTGREIRLVGPGVKTGLNITIDNPAQLGSDMVVNAIAAIHRYPLPLIMIDMGTATTLSAIDEKGRYVGNVIVPGAQSALEYLAFCTSQLPKISLEAPARLIGKNTTECMQSGAVIGTAAILDGMIDRMEEELGCAAAAVATGLSARPILPLCRRRIVYDDTLMMRGLWLIYDKNRPSPKRRYYR